MRLIDEYLTCNLCRRLFEEETEGCVFERLVCILCCRKTHRHGVSASTTYPGDPRIPEKPKRDGLAVPRHAAVTLTQAEAREWLARLPGMSPEHMAGALGHPEGFMGTGPDGKWYSATKEEDGSYRLEEVDRPYSKAATVFFSAPSISPQMTQTVLVGETLSFPITPRNFTGDNVTVQVDPFPLPPNASWNAETGVFTFIPAKDQVGAYDFVFTASDGVQQLSQSVIVTVLLPPVTKPVGRPDPEFATETEGN